MLAKRWAGKMCCDPMIAVGAKGSLVEDCVVTDTGTLGDAGGFFEHGAAVFGAVLPGRPGAGM